MSISMTKAVVLTVCSILIISIAGCEPEGPVNSQSERLFAAENMELKKELAELEKKYQKDLAHQKELLGKCEEEKKVLKTQMDENVMKSFEDSLTNVLMEQTQKLHQENTQLKAEIDELRKQTKTQQ